MNTFQKLLLDCLTGKDCRTFDVGRILFVLGTLTFLVLSAMDAYFTLKFNYSQFGVGFGALLGGGGAGIGFKKDTEPEV